MLRGIFVKLEIFVVSMPNADVRRKKIEEDLLNCPFKWKFIDAAPGSGDLPYSPTYSKQIYGRELRAAEIGCFESHIRAIRHYLHSSDCEFLLVCEDDVYIDLEFPFKDLMKAMNESNILYVRLFSRRIALARHLTFWRNRWLVRYLWEPFGTQCYIISRCGAEHILERLTKIVRPIDDQLDRSWEIGLPTFAIFPHPVLERQSPSSIPRTSQRSSRLRKLYFGLRRMVDRLRGITSGVKLTKQDRAFAASLRRTGMH